MPQDFQTTFIPKKPVTDAPESTSAKRKRSSATSSIYTILGIGILIIGVAFSGGMYLYSGLLDSNIAAAREDLRLADESLETGFIENLQDFDARMRVGQTLLSEHVSLSPFFRFVENNTLKSIQYNSFNFEFANSVPTVTMSGVARRYQTIAEQSVLFGQSPFILNHIFSNFTLTEEGRVAFNLVIELSEDIIYFEQSLEALPRNQQIQATNNRSDGTQRMQLSSDEEILSAGSTERESGESVLPTRNNNTDNASQENGQEVSGDQSARAIQGELPVISNYS